MASLGGATAAAGADVDDGVEDEGGAAAEVEVLVVGAPSAFFFLNSAWRGREKRGRER